MNRALYSLIGYLLLPVLLARLLVKSFNNSAYRQDMIQRLGWVRTNTAPVIWIHCVSVGEFRAAIVLIDRLLERHPEQKILISSTTPTGFAAVREHYGDQVLQTYFPFDLPWAIKRYIKRIKPKACILLETEIWPNLIHQLNQKQIPTLLVNARLSEHSLQKYQNFAPKLAKQTLNKLTKIAAQNANSAQRFITLGAAQSKVLNAGNIKFEQALSSNHSINQALADIAGDRPCLVCASTHEGEEMKILKRFKQVKAQLGDALLVIVPRHFERFDNVFKLIQNTGLSVVRRSSAQPAKSADVLLGDSMGEMMGYFHIADVVFVGGSLNNTGGHNMLEPAALAKPIIFGPNVFNFSEISQALLKAEAAIQVKDVDDLFNTVQILLKDSNKAQNLGVNAKHYVDANQGAVDTLEELITQAL